MKTFLALLVIAVVAAAFFLARGGAFGPAARPSVAVPEGAIDNDPTRPAGKLVAGSLESKIVGRWQEVGDADFARVFAENGQFHDEYRNDPAGAPGTWALGPVETPSKFPPLLLSSEGDALEFRISVDNADGELVLTYVGEGEEQFRRVR